MMRQIRLWAATLCVLALLTACTDAPTLPEVVGAGAVAGTPPSYDSQTVQGCVTKGLCYLPPISGGGSTCDPYLEMDWSCDGGSSECMTSLPGGEMDTEYVGLAGCDPLPTKPIGGTEPLPPDPVPGDTCNTGDQVVDDPKVSQGLQDLWARSNPDANLAQRRETAGWIVQTTAGFHVVPITTTSSSFGCADFVVRPPTTGTVVGFVHTHPYEVDETIIDCDFTRVQDYTGAPSDADRKASTALGNYFGRSGGLPGYIIDKDGYYRFEGSNNTATPRLLRCGY